MLRLSPQKKPVRGVVSDPVDTVRRILPTELKTYSFLDFLQASFPNLPISSSFESSPYSFEMRSIVIAPLDSLTSQQLQIRFPECREPLASLVDDVVWTLVQRRERGRRTNQDFNNVLTQGYSTPLGEGQVHGAQSFHMRPGVVCSAPNEQVSFCKTSKLFQALHVVTGDDVLRMMMLHTRIFVPMEENLSRPRGFYVLICGPRLRRPYSQLQSAGEASRVKVKRKIHVRQKNRKRQRLSLPMGLQANACISRFLLFYADSFLPKVGLGMSHPLNDKNTTPVMMLALMTDLVNNENGKRRRKRWIRVRDIGTQVATDILKQHRQCDYHRLLNHYCPLPQLGEIDCHDDTKRIQPNDSSALPSVGQAYSSLIQVESFVVGTLSRVFPVSFWGSQLNFESVIESVRAFLRLRRHEKLTNKQLMCGIRVKSLRWLHRKTKGSKKWSRLDHEATSALLLTVLRWVFRGFIIPLLRSNFYATETEFSAKRVHYYRKPVWSVFRALSTLKLLGKQYKEILSTDSPQVETTLGVKAFSRLRLLPKATGVRPIAHLSQKRAGYCFKQCSRKKLKRGQPTTELKSANKQLTHVFDVLKFECSRNPKLYGAGLGGLHDFYPKYYNFIRKLRRSSNPKKTPVLYFATVDIEKCYDRMNQEYVLHLASKILSMEDYCVQEVSLHRSSNEYPSREVVRTIVGAPSDRNVLPGRLHSADKTSHGVVLVAKKSHFITRKEIVEQLSDHLLRNHVVISGRHQNQLWVQANGVSQGSILSMLLCNIYYGNIENELLSKDSTIQPAAEPSVSFLARQVDDFLFISSSKTDVDSFLHKMYVGKPELGVQINEGKTVVSAESSLVLRDSQGNPKIVNVSPREGPFFSWCGMLFETKTGEVSIDYSRFQKGLVRDSLTVYKDGKEGERLISSMQNFVLPRCIPILYDMFLNSSDTIVYNYYQMMLYAAVKTVLYLREMGLNKKNSLFVYRSIKLLPAYTLLHICRGLRSQCPCANRGPFLLNNKSATWLCLHAFQEVLHRLSDLVPTDLPAIVSDQLNRLESVGFPLTLLTLALSTFNLKKMTEGSTEATYAQDNT